MGRKKASGSKAGTEAEDEEMAEMARIVRQEAKAKSQSSKASSKAEAQAKSGLTLREISVEIGNVKQKLRKKMERGQPTEDEDKKLVKLEKLRVAFKKAII